MFVASISAIFYVLLVWRAECTPVVCLCR